MLRLLLPILMCLSTFAAPADDFSTARQRMVDEHIAARGVRDARVLQAMRTTPRHRFVPEELQRDAYEDRPLPIGEGQTISQPYIVALMTELAQPKATDRALEVGTGSGYQAAVLSGLVERVYTIELESQLGQRAEAALRELKLENVTTRIGDGYAGWPQAAPFDIILVTAAPDHLPQPLIEQLKPGGRLIAPVGPVHGVQQLRVIEKDASGELHSRDVAAVRFVPLRRTP